MGSENGDLVMTRCSSNFIIQNRDKFKCFLRPIYTKSVN